MDNFPLDLTRQIIQFARGDAIHFNRDDSGRIKEIIGITNKEDASHIVFNYETDRFSAHAMCINEPDEFSSTDLMFCDIHLHLPIENCWSYIANITEIDQKDKNITKYHTSRKIMLNGIGRIEAIYEDNKPVYSAQYNGDGSLLCEHQNGIRIEYGYNDLGSKIFKKTFKQETLIEHWTYEYEKTSIGPYKEYLQTSNRKILKQINVYVKNYDDGYSICLKSDGIKRNYYTCDGDLLSSFYLPINKTTENYDYTLEDVINQSDIVPSIEFSVVDKESGSIRTIQKENGYFLVDQTAIYSDGLLSKVINSKNSLHKHCSISLFDKKWWKQVV